MLASCSVQSSRPLAAWTAKNRPFSVQMGRFLVRAFFAPLIVVVVCAALCAAVVSLVVSSSFPCSPLLPFSVASALGLPPASAGRPLRRRRRLVSSPRRRSPSLRGVLDRCKRVAPRGSPMRRGPLGRAWSRDGSGGAALCPAARPLDTFLTEARRAARFEYVG